MPESVLAVLKLLFLALLYLFFFRVLRAVWVETREPAPVDDAIRPEAERRGKRSAGRPASPVAVARLRVIAPAEGKGRLFEIGDEVTVGRAAGCQVALTDDSTVSQLHARLFRRDGRLYVEDLGSTNGTFVNRRAVTGATAVRRGDRLQFGESVLEVVR